MQSELTLEDREHIDGAVEFIRVHDTVSVLARILPALAPAELAAVASHCRFAHTAVLVFPRIIEDVRAQLLARGLDPSPVTPSVVVRDRLSRRYGRPARSLEVGIVRAPVISAGQQVGEIEVFALATGSDPELLAIAATERAAGHETHLAFQVGASDPVVLAGLRSLFTDDGGFAPDGGGYNPHGNETVLYFRDAARSGSQDGRIEMMLVGRHGRLLQNHVNASVPPAQATANDASRELLSLMTGAWTTQAIATAAELGVADHLARLAPQTGAQLAAATKTHPDGMARLLRYLASIGVVSDAADEGYRLTARGERLRTDVEASLHPLALLYGGAFYQSFASLTHAVRTGREAFQHVFGQHHFDYFAAEPVRASLFDRAMAASSAMFAPVPALVDLTKASTVVDVAGGNGALLGRLLTETPHLRGVLLERPHAVAAARTKLESLGCLDRCELVVGDFTTTVPSGGDVYVLSRVLHDWDDEQCAAILARCAEAMDGRGELLVVERLLPDNSTASSLAVAWDLHMMCNVGGRERTRAHYARLLASAGLELVEHHGLPLDAALLRARPRVTTDQHSAPPS